MRRGGTKGIAMATILKEGRKEIYTEDGAGWRDWIPVRATRVGSHYLFYNGCGTLLAFDITNSRISDNSERYVTFWYRHENRVHMVSDMSNRESDWYLEANVVSIHNPLSLKAAVDFGNAFSSLHSLRGYFDNPFHDDDLLKAVADPEVNTFNK
jgi:hypothetical protein